MRDPSPRRVLAAVALLILSMLIAMPAGAATVARFSPQGTVKGVRQAVAAFSDPMVAFGDVGAPDPFDVACPVAGKGRWIDIAQWAYDFERDLPAGLQCTFTRRAGLATLAGQPLTGPASFSFSTGGPAIKSAIPREGSEWIDEEQAFILALDAEPTAESVLRHVSFAVDGLPQRVAIRIIGGAEREEILKAKLAEPPRGPVMIVQATQRFPDRAKVILVWGKGVAAASGVATDKDQSLHFKVREPFTVRVDCERENKTAGCIPITPLRVRFTAPVPMDQARRVTLTAPDGKQWPPRFDEPESPWADGLTFRGPFPEKTELTLTLPRGLADDAKRAPVNLSRFPQIVKMDAFPPLAKFPARFGIVESQADPALPVTVRNLEPRVVSKIVSGSGSPQDWRQWVQGRMFRVPPTRPGDILPWLRRVGMAERDKSVFAGTTVDRSKPPVTFGLPKPNGADAMEVIGIPFSGPGFYVVELASLRLGTALLGKRERMYVPAAALVTNLGVHFKWGTAASLVWVTALDSARPVDGARVTVHDCSGAVLWSGRTNAQGLAPIASLPARGDLKRCSTDYHFYEGMGQLDEGLFITAQRNDDLAFVHSSWDQGIESWRFRLPTTQAPEPLIAHTVLDRALFRAGETVHMKHLVRQPQPRGIGPVAAGARPTGIVIRHLGSDDRYEFPLAWDGGGVAVGEWAIPKTAKLGTYEIVLRGPGEASPEQTSARFQVQEFRVPLMKAVLRPPAEPLIAATEFPLDVSVQYLAGGGAANLPVVLRAQVTPKRMTPPENFEEFTFANGSVTEGIVRRGAGGDEMLDEDEPADVDGRTPGPSPKIHQREALTLDAAGTARATITKLAVAPTPQDVLAELEYRDPSGETQTASTRVAIWPAASLVGLKPDGWAVSRERVAGQVAVVDVRGKPVSGAAIEVDVFTRSFFSYRKRLVGGFYAYEHVEEVKRVGPLCRGVTDVSGLIDCEGVPPASGRLVLQASTVDATGRRVFANQEVWVAGDSEWWFEAQDNDRIDLLPERKRYEPGETARLQVRMPFREATGLITVEREGVLDAHVVSLSGKAPVIDVPITGAHAPNVFVSAFVVRGRVTGVAPTALVDLGRPAFKLGIAELKVGWRAYELKVSVAADRPVYKVREKARVRVVARTASGQVPPAGSEIALAAVDEGLLELAGNPTWNLLDAMMRRRSYGVETATAQMLIVGKRHYGKKALPQGGGGGRQPTRELFDTLLLWQARVPLDAEGAATIEVPLNDSITSFKIVAVATGGEALFGTGSTSIRTTQDLMVLPGIAPLAREGDRVNAQVTLRNATDRAMTVTATASVTGIDAALPPREVALAAGQAQTIGWDVTAPAGVTSLKWEVRASERGGPDGDVVAVTQRVVPAVPVRVYQASLVQWNGTLREPVERPAEALPGRGGMTVTLAPTIADGLGPMRDWMRRYPYTCLEQQVSRAIALGDERRWREIADTMPGLLDRDGLLKYFPTLEQGSEILTAYVLAISQEAGYALPADVKTRAIAGLEKFVKGTLARPGQMPTADLSIRKLSAVEALARNGATDPALLDSIAVEPNLWPTSAVLDWWSAVRRMPAVPNRDARLREAEQIVRSRLNVQGTTMGFSTAKTDDLWWLMVSSDVNALRLVLSLVDSGQWKDEVPRLMRGALGRQKKGAWDTTVANAWGALAVEKFSRAYEKTPVAGTTTAALNGTTRRLDWAQSPKGGALTFAWPPKREELTVEQAGAGNPWVTFEARAAIPLAAPVSSGYRITKTLTPIEARTPGAWSLGDLVRVKLEIDAQADMTWVVVDDPIPAGASQLGTGLGGQSRIATQGESTRMGPWPAYVERGFESFRAYYAFVPKGAFSVEYTVRLNQAGRFEMPATRVEALYAPEMFGEAPNRPLSVAP